MPSAGDVCRRDVVVTHRATSIVEAATLMRDRHVGSLVVIEEHNGMRVPVGLLTDRDIVAGTIARCEPYLDKLSVGDVLTRAVVVAPEHEDVLHVVHRMRVEGIRRMPVVDKYGALIGIVSLDDLLARLAETLQEMSAVGERQVRREQKQRP